MLLRIALLLLLTSVASAADRPIPADRLLLRDATHPNGAKLRFVADAVPALAPGVLDDPRVAGGSLEIVGSAVGDGATGVIPLRPELWTALGPPGSPTGYRYLDPARGHGIRKIVVQAGSPGSLLIVGGTSALPYRITQPQGAIDVRLTVGDDVYCARLASFAANAPGPYRRHRRRRPRASARAGSRAAATASSRPARTATTATPSQRRRLLADL